MDNMRAWLRNRGLAGSLAIVFVGYPPADVTQTPPVLVQLHALAPREVQSQTFALASPGTVEIEAVGAQSIGHLKKSKLMATLLQRDAENPEIPWSGNAWVLDVASRKIVWELSTSATSQGTGGTREFRGSVQLPAGSYIAYYAAFPDGEYWTDEEDKTRGKQKWHGFGDEPIDKFTLVVRGNGRHLGGSEIDPLREATAASTILALRGTSAEQFQQTGFALSKPTEIEVSVQGEAREDGEFDYGWIANADTRATIWKFSWSDSQPAGGAAKNRMARISRVLPAGRYAAFYATDDSHDPSGWNAPPPHDPDAWGLRIATRNPDDRRTVSAFAYEHVPERDTILALTGVGDSATRKQGFTLTRALDVRIYALGEGRDGRMYDYGWITSSGSRSHVWDMRYDDTEPAGGDRKNRLVDTTLHLQKGSYLVHYVSDDSHSADEWNAAAPADGRRWGITVLAGQGTLDRAAIAPYEEKADPSIVAQLTAVRDDDQVRKRFTLTRDSEVRVFAIGEGTGHEMADYGWIEDAKSGRRVWEMTYRSTHHAGGASKNRRFDGNVKLPAGEYVLRYETDGSHAFGDWNADPPDDPEMWGITVSQVR
jgi:hypothetical protein